MNIETSDHEPVTGQEHPAMAQIVSPGHVLPAAGAGADDEPTATGAEVGDVMQEDEGDVVESVPDLVEDLRSQSVMNHFRI